jgi:hypothetical protein
VLVPTQADPVELDSVVTSVERSAKVVSATWTVETAG